MKGILSLIFCFLYLHLGAQEPVTWAVSVERLSESEALIHFDAQIAPKWHLYTPQEFEDGPLPTEIVFTPDSLNYQLQGPLETSPFKSAFDDIFEIELPYFDEKARFTQRIQLLNPNLCTVSGEINYQACDDKVCIFRTEPFVFCANGAVVDTAQITLTAKDRERSAELTLDLKNRELLDKSFSQSSKDSLFGIFVLGLLGGLLALLTPCVFPMIPLTVSFFLKQGNSLRKGAFQALLYGLFIVLIYVFLSLPFHFIEALNPEILNTLATNVVLNLVFFGVFVFFAFSFFGFYELTLPATWGNKTDQKSAVQGALGIFFMALTLAIVSFSCTGPILGSLLAGSLTVEGGAWQLTAGMTGFGLALAFPFALFALFPNALKVLPKSGGWMTNFKVVLGFLELALALKFLSNADLVSHWGMLKREIFIGLWVVLTLGASLYLLGLFRKKHEKRPTTGRLAVGVFGLFFSAYLINGLVAQDNKLTLLSGFPPPTFYSLRAQESDCPLGLDCYKTYVEGQAAARAQNKPILLDFTGWACVNCRRMEEKVWALPDIYAVLHDDLVLTSLYVDDRAPLPKNEQFNLQRASGRISSIKTVGQQWAAFQSINFNTASQPYYVLLHPNGTLLNAPIQYTDAATFKKWLEEGLQAYGELPTIKTPAWLQSQ